MAEPVVPDPDLPASANRCIATLSTIVVCALIGAGTIPGPSELLHARLFDWGAQTHASVAAGQWWRLLTSTFLHYTWPHLLINLYFLYFFGSLVETVFGPARFFAIFVLASVASSVASYALSGGMSVGASGAVFGLLGATLVSGRQGRAFGLTPEVSILFLLWAGYNLLEGFKTPGVDNAAHIGGFIGGAVAAALLIGWPLTLTVVALCVAALAWSGFQVLRSEKVTARVAAYQLGVAASKAGKLDAAEQDFTRAAPFPPALIDRSALRIRRGNFTGALADAESVLEATAGPTTGDPSPTTLVSLSLVHDVTNLRAVAQLNRAVALHGLDREGEAVAAAGEALKGGNDYTRARAYLIRGRCLIRLGRVPEALADLDQAARSGDSTVSFPARGLIEANQSGPAQGSVGETGLHRVGHGSIRTLKGTRIFTEAELDLRPKVVACEAPNPGPATSRGYVDVQFVIDAYGAVEPGSVQVAYIAVGGSATAAIAYIKSCLYLPAMVHGARVRTRWHQLLSSHPR